MAAEEAAVVLQMKMTRKPLRISREQNLRNEMKLSLGISKGICN